MQQAYSPNLGAAAVRGYCLGYVDDAGNAPSRQPSAKAAYDVERAAGRNSENIDSPLNLWAVGFLAFTKGSYVYGGRTYYYKDLGHVFFMKNLGGGRYEIRDSEVASGARKPYGSIAELVAWFGAYSPTYLGWSTNCDGRQYITGNGVTDMIPDENHLQAMFRAFRGRQAVPEEVQKYVKSNYNGMVEALDSGPERVATVNALNVGRTAIEDNWQGQIEGLLAQLKAMPQNTTDAEKKLQTIRDALGIK